MNTADQQERVMTDKRYRETLTNLMLLGSLLCLMDIDEFLERIYAAQESGPAIDPALYSVACRSLDDVQRVAEAARAMRDVYSDLRRSGAVKERPLR